MPCPPFCSILLSRTFFRRIDAICLSMEVINHETYEAHSSLGDLRFFLWVKGLLFIVLMGAVTKVMNCLHHRTGLDMVKIPKQLLSQDRLDRSLRRQSPATGAKVGGKRVPNRVMEFQRHELEHAQRQAAKHDEAFTRQPGLLHRWHMLAVGTLEVGVLFGLA